MLAYSIAFLHYLWQRPHGQGQIWLTAALVKEWMHFGIRQSGQCTVKCGAAPHPWRNNSDRDLELNQTTWQIAKTLCTTMRQQTSGTQWCTESEGNIDTCQYTMGLTYHSKSYEICTQFQYEEWYVFHTNLCTASSGRHFWYYTPTQLRMYTLNRRHTCTGVCMQVLQWCMNMHIH